MLRDEYGKLSFRRITTLVSFCIMIATWVSNLFYNMKLDPFVYDGFVYITIGGIFGITADKFRTVFGQGQTPPDTTADNPDTDKDKDSSQQSEDTQEAEDDGETEPEPSPHAPKSIN